MKLVVAVVVAWSSIAFAQAKQAPVKVVSPTIAPPPADVGTAITVPGLPPFEVVVPTNGHQTVQRLLVDGKKLLGTKVEVEGTITWIYDCVTALQTKGQTRAQVQKLVDKDPTRCERKKFHLADVASSSTERVLWVVDVPRPPNKLERERLPKDELKNWPQVPKLAVGDRVVVTGTFALSSPHNERNSDGLLVFEAIASAPNQASPTSTLAPPEPPKLAALARKKVDHAPRTVTASNNAIKLSDEATKAYSQRSYDDAIAKYKAALAEWDGHHFAWYGLAGSYIGKKDWAHAVDAIDHAVTLAPDVPMYLLVYGVAIYEATVNSAREAEARRTGADPSVVSPDVTKLDFTKALAPLLRAVQVEPRLWRAHYYIGRIYRDGGFPRAAARAFREAVANGASTTAPFIALVELYRLWGYAKEASDVALLGTARFQGAVSADIWYELGMSYHDQREHKLAIQSFTQALAADPQYARALYQRGQTRFLLKDKAAKTDLEEFLKLPQDPSLEFHRQVANRMLIDLAAAR